MKSTSNPQKLQQELRAFTGTSQYFQHSMGSLLYTDGVRHLAISAAAYWLIDLIASLLPQLNEDEYFFVWRLQVDRSDSSAVLICDDGNDNILISNTIPYTNFPLDSLSLYLCDLVLMLPSEY